MTPVLGVIAALPGEAKAVAGRRGWVREDGLFVCRSDPAEGPGWIVVRSGPGFRAALTAARWLAEHRPDLLVSTGVSGGLAPDSASGNLVLADQVLGPGKLAWDPDPHWNGALSETLGATCPRLMNGPVLTASRPVMTPLAKKSLHLSTRAVAVDMESAAVALAASESRLPFVVLRAICDPVRRRLPPELTDILEHTGQANLGQLAWKLLSNRSLAGDCWQLFRDYSVALTQLRQAWRRILQHLSASDLREALDLDRTGTLM